MPKKPAVKTGDETELYPDTPSGWARRWSKEFEAAEKRLKKFHERGDEAVRRFKDEKKAKATKTGDVTDEKSLNLYASDTITEMAIVYSRKPKANAIRRNADGNDDVARVAGEMLERILNRDVEKSSDTFAQALVYALDDFEKPGLGVIQCRYEVEWGDPVPEVPAITRPDPVSGEPMEVAPAVAEHTPKANESIAMDWKYWKDVLWDAGARVPHEKRWEAFRTRMTRKEMVENFGAIGKLVPLSTERKDKGEDDDPWSQADVWEIHWKEGREVHWYVKGFGKVLRRTPDPLELEGFWSTSTLMANLSTDELVPICKYWHARHLYREIDTLTQRISLLEDAIQVSGVYDSTASPIKRLLSESGENKLIPVQKWALFVEKGGLKGAVDWFPVDMVVAVLEKLEEQRDRKISLLHQVTGMADIMRGAATQSATATEQKIKAQFGSVRVQYIQDRFAEFASELLNIKAELIARHFDAETIIKQSNILNTPDATLAQQAAELIKSDPRGFRIEVKPETINMQDMAQLKQEKTEIVGGVAQSLAGLLPVVQPFGPAGTKFAIQLTKWSVAGLRGSSEAEGLFDQFTAEYEAQLKQQAEQQAMQPPPPDPKLVVQQEKAKGDLAKIQAGTQAKLVETHAKTQGAIAEQAAQAHYNVQERAMDMRQHILETVSQPPTGEA